MRLFLDTSVLLAACNSVNGASRAIFEMASKQGWLLMASPWVMEEVARNLGKFPTAASVEWSDFQKNIMVMDDIVSLDKPMVFPVRKDLPVLLTALAWADVLITLDRDDFTGLLGSSFYSLRLLLPSEFLIEERSAGRLKA